MWWCEASITRTDARASGEPSSLELSWARRRKTKSASSRNQRTTISSSISSTGCVLSMMMRVTPVALTASITLTAWCQTTFICSFVSVMRKLVIPSRELQVHMSIITTINIFETATYSRSVSRASLSARLCRYQRDARTIWLISRPFCAISTRILSRQVLLLRSRTMSIAPGVNTMIPLNPSFRFVILKLY